MKKFYIPDHSETSEDARDIPDSNIMDIQEAAEEAAQWCESNAEGWEYEYPMNYVIVGETGQQYLVEVHKEVVPEFWANTPKPFKPTPITWPEEDIKWHPNQTE